MAPVVPLLALGLLLTGCAVDPAEIDASATPAAIEAEPPADEINSLEPGAVLTEAQTKEIAPDWTGNLRPYRALNGIVYLIKRDQPLPDVFRADMQAQANTITIDTGTTEAAQDVTIIQGKNMSGRLSYATSKTVVIINYGAIPHVSNGQLQILPGWLAHNCPLNDEGPLPLGPDLDSVLAEVNALIRTQPDPSIYEIVVQQP